MCTSQYTTDAAVYVTYYACSVPLLQLLQLSTNAKEYLQQQVYCKTCYYFTSTYKRRTTTVHFLAVRTSAALLKYQ
jgi:hypothetical protein